MSASKSDINICITLAENDIYRLLCQIERAQQLNDFVEIRADYLPKLDLSVLSKIKTSLSARAIFTCRSVKDGGNFEGTDKEQVELLKTAASLGFEYIDVDLRLINQFKNKLENTKIIVSYHHFTHTPSYLQLKKYLKKMRASVGDIYKFACLVKSKKDLYSLYKILINKKPKEQLIVLGMGKIGQISRLLTPFLGGYLTFASLDDVAVAPGQTSFDNLQQKLKLISLL